MVDEAALLGDERHHVADVLVDGASVGAVTSYLFNNVQSAHTISASFAALRNMSTS